MNIYFLSSSTAMVMGTKTIDREVDRDLKNGGRLLQHIHNHPFSLDRLPLGDIAGTTIPSGSVRDAGDVPYYLNLKKRKGLEAAIVINGFNSFEILDSDFSKL